MQGMLIEELILYLIEIIAHIVQRNGLNIVETMTKDDKTRVKQYIL